MDDALHHLLQELYDLYPDAVGDLKDILDTLYDEGFLNEAAIEERFANE